MARCIVPCLLSQYKASLFQKSTLGENLALAWLLKDERLTSVIIGTSSVRQLRANLDTLQNLTFTPDELSDIDAITSDPALQL